MTWLRVFLIAATVVIYAVTISAISSDGIYWPIVFFGDLLSLDWRAQFNIDFLIHLFLLATWIAWREGFTAKGYVFGFLSVFLGGMFGFPYILWAIVSAKGDPKRMLLGVQANS